MPARERTTPHLFILGGTAEAAALAQECGRFGDRLLVTTSLAGRTVEPAPLPGAVRLGGFGGANALADFLEEERVDLLVDATHPFATRISRHARLAAERARVPRLLLQRPPWPRDAGDRWIEVRDMEAAAAAVPRLGKRAFLTVGSRALASFAAINSVHFVVRLIDPPTGPLPLASYTVVLGRGPFGLDAERQLLQRHAIEVLVAKASGGAGTVAKLAAARAAGIPVVMVARPEPEPGASVMSVAEAVAWIAARLTAIEEAMR